MLRQIGLTFLFFSSRRRHTRFDCDWSSDVCSSDLPAGIIRLPNVRELRLPNYSRRAASLPLVDSWREIGSASCRERGEISVGAVSLKKKNSNDLDLSIDRYRLYVLMIDVGGPSSNI